MKPEKETAFTVHLPDSVKKNLKDHCLRTQEKMKVVVARALRKELGMSDPYEEARK
ncbi:MAG: hypothetical protein HQL31_11290 [Planctomycetes bacterium]|nr:hypothetical protein [Planctomycetota bacterium]